MKKTYKSVDEQIEYLKDNKKIIGKMNINRFLKREVILH